jgi:hypothetical protein
MKYKGQYFIDFDSIYQKGGPKETHMLWSFYKDFDSIYQKGGPKETHML